MRNKRILAISAIAISASVFMAACGFGGADPDESVAVSVTPTKTAFKKPKLLFAYSSGNIYLSTRNHLTMVKLHLTQLQEMMLNHFF